MLNNKLHSTKLQRYEKKSIPSEKKTTPPQRPSTPVGPPRTKKSPPPHKKIRPAATHTAFSTSHLHISSLSNFYISFLPSENKHITFGSKIRKTYNDLEVERK